MYRYYYAAGKIRFVFLILFFGTLILAYSMLVCERDYDLDVWDVKNTVWFTLFNMLLCGYNGMFPESAYGQYVLLVVLIFGILVLSLAIEVVFGVMALTDQEQKAVDFITEYEIKEAERTEATSYLAFWWRYAAHSGQNPQTANMSPEEFQEKKTTLYRHAVLHFNEMRRQTSLLDNIESVADGTVVEDLEQAEEDLKVTHQALANGFGGGVGGLDDQLQAIEERQAAIIEKLDALANTA